MVTEGNSMGWLVAIFCLGIPISIVQMLPGASSLRLETVGFTMRTLFRDSSYGWGQVTEFGVVEIKQGGMTAHRMVGFNFVGKDAASTGGRKLSRALAGYEGALPDTYGMKAQKLADLMNACRERFIAEGKSEPGA